jgi:hypothetical protein
VNKTATKFRSFAEPENAGGFSEKPSDNERLQVLVDYASFQRLP